MTEKTPKAPFRRTLKGKLILSMLLVGILPLLIGLIMAFLQGKKEIRDVNGASFEALAVETARKLDLVLENEIAKSRRITVNPTIVQMLEARRDAFLEEDPALLDATLQEEINRWNVQDPALIDAITHNPMAALLQEYYQGTFGEPPRPIPPVTRASTRALFITDVTGRLVASLNSAVPYHHAGEPWWQGAFKGGMGRPHLENVTFSESLNSYTFSLSLPIMDSIRYQVIGILHRVYDAKEFFSPSIDIIRFGHTGHVMLIDSDGTVMSCPLLPTGTRIASPELIPLVTPRHPGWVEASSDGHGGHNTSIIGFAPLPAISRITQDSTDKAWHLFVWQSSEELFAPIQHLFTWIASFGLIAIALLGTLGSMAAGRIVTPIRKLQEAARLIGKGELKEPIQITTNDEIQDLAEAFNRMNDQLTAAFAGLTSQVELKTQEVEYLQESTSQILDGVPDPIFMLDTDERIQYLNQACKDAFHLDNVNGQSVFALLQVDPETHQKLRRELRRVAEGLPISPQAAPASPTFGQGSLRDPLSPELAAVGKDTQAVMEIHNRLYRYEWFTVRGRSGEKSRVGLVLRDSTEETHLHDRLTQNEKWASLGLLSSGIGHELNNPLVGVIGLGEAIQDEKDPDQVKAYAKDIVQHGRRMASIIQDLTGQIRRQTKGRLAAIDLNDQLQHALKFVQLTHDIPGIEVKTDLQPLPGIHAHPDEMRQVFMNIITNAVQAMKGRGKLTIRSKHENGVITILISDSGPGIPKIYLPRIFDPFFTTKRQGEGSGLGLTVVKRIINRYGGDVQVESAEGNGTTCCITLPTVAVTESKKGQS